MAIIIERYRNHGIWFKDGTGLVVLSACEELAFEEIMEEPNDGFLGAKVQGNYVYSCYTSPSAICASISRC